MGVKEVIERLEKSTEFSEWRHSNKQAYLAHAFTIKENDKFDSWQIGYYNKAHQKITVFEMGESIEIMPESEVFKREETEVRALDIKRVNIELDKALEIAEGINAEKYPQIKSSKQIIILQNIEQGQLWNITFVSASMDVLNIKLDAGSGEILNQSLNRLFEFRNVKNPEEDF